MLGDANVASRHLASKGQMKHPGMHRPAPHQEELSGPNGHHENMRNLTPYEHIAEEKACPKEGEFFASVNDTVQPKRLICEGEVSKEVQT